MRKTTMFALSVAAFVALGCGAGTTGNGSGSNADNNGAKGNDAPATIAKLGEPARDGKFEFIVQQSKCGHAKVGSGMLEHKAQGQFCLVTVKVKNIGKEPQTFSDSSQKAYAADGTEYSTDSAAAMYANKDQQTLFTEINPGNEVSGVLVFDIPTTATLAKLELHDSPFSGGVTVALS